MVRIVDATFENRMMGVSSWTVPEGSGNFCSRGGRFGAHSTNENMTPIYYGRVIFVAFFNAGVRALDIRDPFNPKEIAYYIPPVTANTDKRCVGRGADERCKVAIQTNNVEVDDRGYIYIVDRANTGLHILELSGAARRVANFPANSTKLSGFSGCLGYSGSLGKRGAAAGVTPRGEATRKACGSCPDAQRITIATVTVADPFISNQPTPSLTRSNSSRYSPVSGAAIANSTVRVSPGGVMPSRGMRAKSSAIGWPSRRRRCTPRLTPPCRVDPGSHRTLPTF
jgi:hypothetical protein